MKKYLIVGINRYRHNTYPTTEGAVNSAISWQYFLKEKEFEGQVLLNEFATSDAILLGLENMIENLTEGDFATFIYIGHGGQWKNKLQDGLEEDGKDELLYPFAYSIKDDEIRKILDKNDKNVPVLIILDCCRNGVDESLKLFDEAKNEIVISSTQAKTDMELGEKDSYRQSIFAYYAQNILYKNANINYEEFINIINQELEKSHYKQRPKIIASNYQFLKTEIFSPAIIGKNLISEQFIENFKKNKNVGIGQIHHETEDYEIKDTIFLNKMLNKIKTIILTKN